MSFKIIFCNDGHLRVLGSEKKPLIPLIDFQNESNLEDFEFMVRFWDEDVIFENGLTIGTFLKCLEPWANFWSIYTHKDINAYIKESKQPAEVKPDREKWYAMISYIIEPRVQSKMNKSIDDYENINDFFNDKTPPTVLPFWDFDSYYKLTGYKIGEIEHYSLDHSPINEIAHFPLVLSHYQTVLFHNDYILERNDLQKDNLFNYHASGVREFVDGNYKIKYVLGDKKHSLRDVIDAFFWWFASTPVARDNFNDSLKETISQLDLNEKQDFESTDSSESKEMKVVVNENAFSGIAAQFDRETNYFERVLKYSKSKSKTPIKIGKLQEQGLIEKRIERMIVNDEDISLIKKQ